MAIYKKKNGNGKVGKYYWLSFMRDGRLIQISTKETNKRRAEDFAANYRSSLYYERIGLEEKKEKRPSQTFAEAVNSFLDSLSGTVKESTIAAYRSKSKAPVERFGKKLVDKISREDVEAFRTWRQAGKKKAPARLLRKKPSAKTGKPISPATCNREMTLIAMVLNYAAPGHWQSIVRPPEGGRKLKQLIEDPESGDKFFVIPKDFEDRYLAACSQPLQDVATIILDAGLRPHEVLNLRPEHIDLSQGVLRVTKSKTKAGKREVSMTARVRAIVQRRIAETVNGWLFAGGRNGKGALPIVKLTNSHLKAIAAANEVRSPLRLVKPHTRSQAVTALPTIPRFRLYDCRHTWATRLCERGVDLMTVKALGGWSSLKMVERYAHPTKQHQADAIRRLEPSVAAVGR